MAFLLIETTHRPDHTNYLIMCLKWGAKGCGGIMQANVKGESRIQQSHHAIIITLIGISLALDMNRLSQHFSKSG